jgi:hypothetical protein
VVQPCLENLDAQSILPSAGVARPDVCHRNADPIVVSLHAGVSTKALFLVIDRWLDEPFDDADLTTEIKRHSVVTEREAFGDPDLLTALEPGRLAKRGHYAQEYAFGLWLLFHGVLLSTKERFCPSFAAAVS